MSEEFDLDRVRKRPGMYIGPTDDRTGLHQMVFEVVGNAVNEAAAGHATQILVTLSADGSCTVRDNGRGMPTEFDEKEGLSAAEFIMTRLHAAGKYCPSTPNVFQGSGIAVVNALSEWLDLQIWRSGKEHHMHFRLGTPEAPLKAIGDACGKTGTQIRFLPSPKIFTTVTFDRNKIAQRCHELASLVTTATINVVDER